METKLREDIKVSKKELEVLSEEVVSPKFVNDTLWLCAKKMAIEIVYFFILHDLKLYDDAAKAYEFCLNLLFPNLAQERVEAAATAYIDIFRNHDLIEDDSLYANLVAEGKGEQLISDHRWDDVHISCYLYASNVGFSDNLATTFAKENVAYLKAHTNNYDEAYIPHILKIEEMFTEHVLGRQYPDIAELQGRRYLDAILNHDSHTKLSVMKNLELMTKYYHTLIRRVSRSQEIPQ